MSKVFEESFEGNLEGLELKVFGENNYLLFNEVKDFIINCRSKNPNISSILRDRGLTYLHVESYNEHINILDNNVLNYPRSVDGEAEQEKYNEIAKSINDCIGSIDVYLLNKTRMFSESPY